MMSDKLDQDIGEYFARPNPFLAKLAGGQVPAAPLESMPLNAWQMTNPVQSSITFICPAGSGEILKISPDGFYVRGVKIEQGPDEAQAVYSALCNLMQINNFHAPVKS